MFIKNKTKIETLLLIKRTKRIQNKCRNKIFVFLSVEVVQRLLRGDTGQYTQRIDVLLGDRQGIMKQIPNCQMQCLCLIDHRPSPSGRRERMYHQHIIQCAMSIALDALHHVFVRFSYFISIVFDFIPIMTSGFLSAVSSKTLNKLPIE